MTQRVAPRGLKNTGFDPSFLKCALQDGFVEMMPALFAGNPVGEMTGRRKNPLPVPFFTGIWIFSIESIRQGNPAKPPFEIRFVLRANLPKMLAQRISHRAGQHRVAIFVSLPRSNNDLVAQEINIFDPKTAAFHESQTATVEQNRHQTRHSVHAVDDFLDFVFREYDWQPLRSFRAYNAFDTSELFAQHFLIEK